MLLVCVVLNIILTTDYWLRVLSSTLETRTQPCCGYPFLGVNTFSIYVRRSCSSFLAQLPNLSILLVYQYSTHIIGELMCVFIAGCGQQQQRRRWSKFLCNRVWWLVLRHTGVLSRRGRNYAECRGHDGDNGSRSTKCTSTSILRSICHDKMTFTIPS